MQLTGEPGSMTHLRVGILLQRGISTDRPRLQFGEQRYADSAQEAGQPLGGRQTADDLLMLVDEIATQITEILIHKRRQRWWFRQASDMPVTHRTVPTLWWRIFIAKILRQSVTEAAVRGKQLEHGVNPGNFSLLMPGEISMQLDAQILRIEVRFQDVVDLGHLLAFQLDPALLVKNPAP